MKTSHDPSAELGQESEGFKCFHRFRRRDSLLVIISLITTCILVAFCNPLSTQFSPNRELLLQNIGNKEQLERLTRPFLPWKSNFSWCVPPDTYDINRPTGLLYVKVPKTASSTLAGVNERIARNHGPNVKRCMSQSDHLMGSHYANRNRQRSFLWGSVRDPTRRAISEVFFNFVSRKGMEPTDYNVIGNLKSFTRFGEGGVQFKWLTPEQNVVYKVWSHKDKENVKDPSLVEQYVKEVIDSYDFLAVAERIDESLVALQLLLGLNPGDIIYLSAKVTGGYDDGWTGHCVKTKAAFISPDVSAFFQSRSWRAQNAADFLLYDVANRCLDLTIDRLGRDRFDRELARHRELLAIAQEKCTSSAIFPCSSDGVLQKNSANCYFNDSGCGYPCLDELLRKGSIADMLGE